MTDDKGQIGERHPEALPHLKAQQFVICHFVPAAAGSFANELQAS
jgi:hypothetical protein